MKSLLEPVVLLTMLYENKFQHWQPNEDYFNFIQPLNQIGHKLVH